MKKRCHTRQILNVEFAFRLLIFFFFLSYAFAYILLLISLPTLRYGSCLNKQNNTCINEIVEDSVYHRDNPILSLCLNDQVLNYKEHQCYCLYFLNMLLR